LNRRLWAIVVILGLIPVGESVYFHARLPETIPTHFDGQGCADDWGWKTPYCIVAAMVPAAIGLLLVPWLFLIRPGWIASPLCRLPNKAYWTAPERIGGAVSFLRRQHLWFVIATMVVMVVISHLMLRSAATGRGPSNRQMLIVLGGYLAVVGLWLVRLIAHFRRADV
jgi:hypothetical protein